jgi:cobalt-zinc-cadmium efflux system protein
VTALVSALVLVQVTAAYLTGSLALASEAGHMATDALGMGISLAAVSLAAAGSRREHRTFGWYRLEILAALTNAVLLLAVGVAVIYEAISRISDPPDIDALPLGLVGALGAVVSLIAWRILASTGDHMVTAGALLEVASDTVGSMGVVIGSIVMAATGWSGVDALVGAAIGIFVLPRAARLAAASVRILVQAAPVGTDVETIRAALGSIDGVVDVHDLHIWTLSGDMHVLTAHIMVGASADHHQVLDRARVLLKDDHSLEHATLQIEPEDHTGCDDVDW